jgi:hypothetical protein
MNWNEIPHDPHHQGVPSGASKTISEPFGMFGANRTPILHRHKDYLQTVRNKIPHDHVTLEFHRVHIKWFLNLWYVWCKLCTYLALTLALSLNRPKRVSTWRTSSSSSIGCIQNDFWAMVHSTQTVHLSCTDTNTISKWTEMRFHMTHIT